MKSRKAYRLLLIGFSLLTIFVGSMSFKSVPAPCTSKDSVQKINRFNSHQASLQNIQEKFSNQSDQDDNDNFPDSGLIAFEEPLTFNQTLLPETSSDFCKYSAATDKLRLYIINKSLII